MTLSTTPKPRLIFIYDLPRTRSHLFFKYLGTHPDVQSKWHPYLPAHQFGPENILPKLSDDVSGWRTIDGCPTYEMATKAFREAYDEAMKDDKILVSNEHVICCLKQQVELAYLRGEPFPETENPTNMPDDMFEASVPVFIIRHPVFAVKSLWAVMSANKSLYRPSGDMWKLMTAVALQRQLIEYLQKKTGKNPIIIDGDDVVLRPEELATKLCSALGISDKLSSSWTVTPESERPKDAIVRQFLKDIDESTGIIRLDEAPEIKLSKVHQAWVEGYGQKTADELKQRVEDVIPHYEYLKQFAL